MGMEENSYGYLGGFKPFHQFHETEEGEEKAREQIRREKAIADAESTRYLAEIFCPADLIEWGRAHGIETFAQITWMAGFAVGWRAMTERRAKSLEDRDNDQSR